MLIKHMKNAVFKGHMDASVLEVLYPVLGMEYDLSLCSSSSRELSFYNTWLESQSLRELSLIVVET